VEVTTDFALQKHMGMVGVGDRVQALDVALENGLDNAAPDEQ